MDHDINDGHDKGDHEEVDCTFDYDNNEDDEEENF